MQSKNNYPKPHVIFITIALVAMMQSIWAFFIMDSHVTIASIICNQLLVIMGIALAVIGLGRYKWQYFFQRARICRSQIIAMLAMTVGMIMVIEIGIVWINRYLPPDPQLLAVYESLLNVDSFSQAILKVIALCLLPAICEEFLFRGFCQSSLMHHWKTPALALLTTALYFALLHGIINYLPLYMLMAIVFGIIYWRTQNLWLAIAAHAINNSWTLANHHFDFIDISTYAIFQHGLLLIAAIALMAVSWWVLKGKGDVGY